MITVVLDPRGQLTTFEATPPRFAQPDDHPNEFDWAVLFAEAGLDITRFTSVDPIGPPPVGCDARCAWTGSHPDYVDIQALIEAASLWGKPVHFAMLKPWNAPQAVSATPDKRSIVRTVLAALFLIIRIGVIAGCVAFARRNLRLGRGDRRGATRLAVCLFVLISVEQLLVRKHQGLEDAEFWVLVNALGFSLFWSAFCWAAYLAIEPYARRAWPERIISWTRFLSGQFRDPLVGRDILVGLLASVVSLLLFHLIVLAAHSFGLEWGGASLMNSPNANLSMRQVLAVLLSSFRWGAVTALWALFFLVAVLAVARRRLATPIFVLLLFLVCCANVSRGDLIVAIGAAAITAATISISMLRFGLLTFAFVTVSNITYVHFTPTFDFSAWYAGNVWFAVSILVALAIYGFVTATKGQSFFKDEVFTE